jgi:DHA1 family tetracycline resistance protein-like MFS transporter
VFLCIGTLIAWRYAQPKPTAAAVPEPT